MYNQLMDYVSIVLSVFIIEFIVDILVLKIFKIQYRFIYVLFLQVPKICASVLCLIYSEIIWICILVKTVSKIICLIFITDSFRLNRIISLILTNLILLFSIGGFLEFLSLCFNFAIKDIFMQNIDKKHRFLILFSILLYIFAFFRIVRTVEKNKFLKNYLAKVSFFICGKHINLYGLVDSGNSLLDPITRLPVVLVSVHSLKKFLTVYELDVLIGCESRKIRCETIAGSGFEIPIFKIGKLSAKFGKEFRKYFCMIGIVDHRFEKGKIDCLLHRDFL